MKNLYAPWRSNYTNSTARTKNENSYEEECVFCLQLQENNDEKNFIIRRFQYNAILFARYPYNAGHLLIITLDHNGRLYELSGKTRTELMDLAAASSKILRKIIKAEGINMGLNLGKVAGAGIPSHLHMHVLPRFYGDTNFMPTLAQVKPISFDLAKIYKQLKPEFDKI